MLQGPVIRDSEENQAAGINVSLLNSNLQQLYHMIDMLNTGLARIDLAANAGSLTGDVINNYCYMDFYVTTASFQKGETLPAAVLYTKRPLVPDEDHIIHVPASIADVSSPPIILNNCCLLYIASKGKKVTLNKLDFIESTLYFTVFRQPPAEIKGGTAVHCSLYMVL
jgi:hypothetical protein